MTDARQNEVYKEAESIVKALDLIQSCCDIIEECGGCRECPLFLHCLRDDSGYDTCTDVSRMRWSEFIGFADDIEEIMEERNKTDEERQYEDWWNEQERKWEGDRDERAFDW